jgi:UDP-N-acetylmuramoylalanine--D-glutamate ligase
MHRNFEEYLEAKKNIVRYQNREDFAILNYDDQNVKKFVRTTKAKILFFSQKLSQKSGAYLKNDYFITNFRGNTKQYIKKKKMKMIGDHNFENILAGIMVGAIYNIKAENINQVLTNFRGLPHRIQYIKNINGVKYYNDSKATTPVSTIVALNSFSQKVILLAGGFDKQLALEKLAKEIINHAKNVILFGQMAKRLEKTIQKLQSKISLNQKVSVSIVDNLEQAVNNASCLSQKGDIVLLSPSTSSFDQFRDFEERGEKFIHFVKKLAKVKGA